MFPATTLMGRAPLRPYSQFASMRYAADPDPVDPKPVDPPAPEPAKLSLTQAEIDAQISAALKAERDATAAKAAKDKEDADRAKAEEQGEFQKIADQEKARADKAESESATLRCDIAIRDALADKPEYLGCAKYVTPLVDSKLTGDALAKAAKAAVEQYVKDNPREQKKTAGVPPVRTGNRQTTAGGAPAGANTTARRRFSNMNYNG